MGEKNIFNPTADETFDIVEENKRPSGTHLQQIGPGVNVMRDADGEIIGLYDDLGNPIAQ